MLTGYGIFIPHKCFSHGLGSIKKKAGLGISVYVCMYRVLSHCWCVISMSKYSIVQ